MYYFQANPMYLVYITVTTCSVFYAGIKIEKLRQEQTRYMKENKEVLSKEEKRIYKDHVKKRQWRYLIFALVFNLGILAVVKYTNFTIYNVNIVLQWLGTNHKLAFVEMLIPMGISFYTFQAAGYLIDVYRGTCKAENKFFRFALFVSFFPQLVQGPISRYNALSETLYEEHKFDWKKVSFGLQRILWGYFKKLVIADRILVAVNEIIGNTVDYKGTYVLVGMLFYALELYTDFTGGIDITIGIAQTLGITVAENFNRPYFSKSVKEYWRRWHISMGTWFTDYIFYPISVCRPMLRITRFSRKHFGEFVGKRIPVYLSSFAVWFATGIWHGASWNFVIWGLLNWAVIMVSQELEPLYTKFHEKFGNGQTVFYKCFQVVRTVLLMSCLRLFDCYRDVPLTLKMFGSIFSDWDWMVLYDGSLLAIGLDGIDYVILIVGTLMLAVVSLCQKSGSVRQKIAGKPYWIKFTIWYGLFLIVLLMGAYGIGYDASQFIYNQF